MRDCVFEDICSVERNIIHYPNYSSGFKPRNSYLNILALYLLPQETWTSRAKMTSLFPHPVYAEDQPNAHAILYLHVMRASAMSFSFASLMRFPASLILSSYRKQPIDFNTLFARTLHTSGRSLLLGVSAGALMTWGRMRGREGVEWKDRSWRILENKGEVKTDWVTLGGAGAGAVAAVLAARRGRLDVSAGKAVLGGTGIGMASGVPYMIASFAAGRKPA